MPVTHVDQESEQFIRNDPSAHCPTDAVSMVEAVKGADRSVVIASDDDESGAATGARVGLGDSSVDESSVLGDVRH